MPNTVLPSAARCPDRDVLRAFYSGELPSPEIETVGSHLATCETCLAILDSQNSSKLVISLAAADSAKSSLLDDTAVLRVRQDAAFQRMVAQVKRIEFFEDRETRSLRPEEKRERQSDAQKHPENIGPYFIAKHLGRGGFANVYKARGPEGRVVAIKVPRKDKLKSPSQIEEFLREAQTAATLDHPHIVPVYDFGREADGSCYVVMKYIEGQSLEDAMASESMGLERIAEICAQIAGALDYAHNYDYANKKGLIHRDIKPANILLDKQGKAYIADFGLAIHEETQQDIEDQIAGTYDYMSPEQVRGVTRHLDARTDIWSLGVVMYELLTRQRPFPKTKDLVRMEENFKFHSIKPPRSINSKVPEELERICLGCLNKDIDQRTASAAKLATDLRKWLWAVRFQRFAWKASGWAAAIAIMVSLAWAGSLVVMGNLGGVERDIPIVPSNGGIAGPPTTTIKKPLSDGESDFTKSVPPNNSFAREAGVAGEWESLFDVKPELFFGHPGPDREPAFDVFKKSYVVNSNSGRWMATVRKITSQHLQVRTKIGLHNWLDQGGVVWGVTGEDQSQPNQILWRCVEFSRFRPNEKPQLVIRELTLSGASLILHNRHLKDYDVDVPANTEAEMDIEIEPNLLTIKFEDNPIWRLKPSEAGIKTWLPKSSINLGISGESSHTVFRDLSIRYPQQKE